MRPAVFFDRDDTLIECRSITPDGDLGDPALVRLKEGALEACRMLREAGFALVVVSNQGGVARGKYSEDDVHAVNAEVNRRLGGLIERFYFCPYHPKGTVPQYTGEHPWRKPAPGMLLAAAEELGLDLRHSWIVGDQPRDAEAGCAAGCRAVVVDANPRGPAAGDAPSAVRRAPSLTVAAAEIIAHGAPHATAAERSRRR